MESNISSSNKRKRAGEEVEAKAKVLKVCISSGNNDDNGNGGIPVLLSDPALLDCNICLNPLSPPIFQCQDGHIACNMCCHKNSYKCSRCAHPIGTIRCLIIEKLVETIKLPCRYSQLGCKEMPSYCQKSTHEKNCIHSPCHCPFSQCKFVGSSKQLSQHFKDNHSSERTEFSFGKPFSVCVKLYEPFIVLQSSDGPLFLLNNFNIITSNSFTIASLDNNNPKLKNLYHLTLKNGDDILTFSSRAKVTNRKYERSTLNGAPSLLLLDSLILYRGSSSWKSLSIPNN
ncbi:hypothetical protein Sjap_017559 [Stephania japonica]|uniref:RING-type E3 ubiquitin transferase n=1 Tax=Stephania japonica TaxID=461633 RepID=A0AAP0I6D4_9MAGN